MLPNKGKENDMATTFTNQASLSYNGGTVLSNVASGVMEELFTVSKAAAAESYGSGERIAYAVTIINNGTADATNLTVTDDLGAYDFDQSTVQPLTYVDGSVLYYINGVLQPTPSVSTSDGLSITGISVPAGGNATIIYAADVNEYAPLDTGSVLTNTVTADSTAKAAVSAQEQLPVSDEAQLSVIKSISPVPVTENGAVTYTIRVENSGNTAVTAADNAVISDEFTPALSGISVTLNGTALASPTDYTYDEATALFSTVAGVLTVPAATYEQDPATGAWIVTPGTAELVITGTLM